MKHLVYLIIISVLLSIIINNSKKEEIEKVVTITKTDTIYKQDTIIKEKPTPIYVKSEPDTIYLPSIDSSVPINREIKLYKDSTYEAQVSGIEPFLDYIKVYPRETTIYKEKTLEIKKKQRFNHGIQVGIGYGMLNNKADVYIGYGFQYNF